MFSDQSRRKSCKRWDIPWDAHCLTFSCFRRQPFFNGRYAAGWFLEVLDEAKARAPFHLWAYVIMPEHVHLVIWPAEGITIRSILWHIKHPMAVRTIAWVRRNAPGFLRRMIDRQPNGKTAVRFWERGGGYDRNLRSSRDIHEKIRYVHLNPVRRGLVCRPRTGRGPVAGLGSTASMSPSR